MPSSSITHSRQPLSLLHAVATIPQVGHGEGAWHLQVAHVWVVGPVGLPLKSAPKNHHKGFEVRAGGSPKLIPPEIPPQKLNCHEGLDQIRGVPSVF